MTERTVFQTSRLLEFTTVEELTKLIGATPDAWPAVFTKEGIDNGLDACEEAEVAPEISVTVSTAKRTISISDNGLGIAPDTIAKLVDYTKKTSSREAYIGPTRGAQGNALQTLLAMPFALDGSRGETTIQSRGIDHRITFSIDPVRREPKIEVVERPGIVQNGTCLTVHWPSVLAAAKGQIVQIVRDFPWLNPHAGFTLTWDGETLVAAKATDPGWHKWRPSDPPPAHWHDSESFSRLIAAYVADDEDRGRDRLVREFVAEFRGFARSDAQAALLDEVDAARTSLRDLFREPSRVEDLLACMRYSTKPVAAKDLGVLGKAHFKARFAGMSVAPLTFQYRRIAKDFDGVPYVIEAAFGYCPKTVMRRRLVVGVNWSPSLINPFRDLGPDGLDGLLAEQRANRDEPIVLALHLASPRVTYTDKAKSAVQLPPFLMHEFRRLVEAVTKLWAKVRKAEERFERRDELMSREPKEKINAIVPEIMPASYRTVSGPNNRWANARQIMYVARPEILQRSGKSKFSDAYFTQVLLPKFIRDNPKLTAKWKVAYDDRGHFADPHTGLMIGLGTVAVREYVRSLHELKIKQAAIAAAHVDTRGPHGSFGAVLYIEKEGFMNLLDEAKLAQRFDIAIMSSKGMSVTAARELADEVCHLWKVPLFVLHDFDKAGFSICAGFLRRQSLRYTFKNHIKVFDLGLRMDDVRHLIAEGKDEPAAKEKGSTETRRANMRKNGATEEEAEYLLTRRVELNALTSDEFVAFIERGLTEHGVKKIVPTKALLAETYRTMVHGRDIEKMLKRELKKLGDGAKVIPVPTNLKTGVENYLREHPAERWDAAVAAIVKGKA